MRLAGRLQDFALIFQPAVEFSLLFFFVKIVELDTLPLCKFETFCGFRPPFSIICGKNVDFSSPFSVPVENKVRQPCRAYLLTTNMECPPPQDSLLLKFDSLLNWINKRQMLHF